MNAKTKLLNRFSSKFNVDAGYFLSGGFWLLFAQGSTILGSLLVAVLFANYLSENDYGIYRYIIGLSVLFSTFSLTGINQAILQAASRGHRRFLQESTSVTFKWGIGIVFFSLCGAIYYYLQDNNILAVGCLLIAIFQPLSQLFLNTLSFLYGETRYAEGALMQAVKSIAVSGSSLLALFFTQNILVLIATYLAAQGIFSACCYLFYRPRSETLLKTEQVVWNKYISFAKHSSYRNIFSGVAYRLDAIVIFQFLGAAELALFSIATLLPEQIRGSFKNLQTLLLPKYTQHESNEIIKKSVPWRSAQLFVALSVFSLCFIAIVPFVYELLFPKYLDAIPYVQLLALTFPASIYLIPHSALQAQQMEKELYTYQILISILQVFFLGILVFYFGLLGAIISRIIGQYCGAIILYYLLYR